MFFVFQEMKVFNPKLKNSCFVFRRTPSGFSLLFLKMFHFTIDFYYCFRVFSLLIAFIHFSFFFAMTFLSGTSFLCCYTAKATGGFYFTLLPDIWCNVGCSNNTIAPTCFPGRKQFRFEDYRASH